MSLRGSNSEIWVRCAQNPDWEVSRFGQVRRLVDHGLVSIRIISGPNERQYRAVQWRKPDCRSKPSVPVSHLILESFGFKRPSRKHVVFHQDSDLTNDNLDNLEWKTRSDSARLATDSRYGQERAALVRGRGGKSEIADDIAHRVCRAICDGKQPYDLIAEACGVSKQFVAQIASGHRRAHVAVQYGLLDDSPNLIKFAWPYLSESERAHFVESAKRAIHNSTSK